MVVRASRVRVPGYSLVWGHMRMYNESGVNGLRRGKGPGLVSVTDCFFVAVRE